MAREVDKTIPNFENATPGFLVDELERIRTESSRLKFLEGVTKQALEARVTPEQKAGNQLIEGDKAIGSYDYGTQERVDPDAVKELLKDRPDELKQVMKVINITTLRTKPKVTQV